MIKTAVEPPINLTFLRLFMWSGMGLLAALIVAQLFLMEFIPPPAPSSSAQEIADRFIDRRDEIRLGAVIQIIFWTFWGTWATGLIGLIRTMERGVPILSYAAIGMTGANTAFFILIPMTWGVLAFRPESLDPSFIQIANDWVWFLWLFTVPAFSVFMALIGLAILQDRSATEIFPRWVGWLTMWAAVMILPGVIMVFFYSGPFSYEGIFVLYLPAGSFVTWMVTMTIMTLRWARKQVPAR